MCPGYIRVWVITELFLILKSRGYSVQKNLRECAANMGSKSASWFMNDPLLNAKRKKKWYMNGSIFKNFQKFEPSLKNRVILVKIWPKIQQIGINEWVTFFIYLFIYLFILNWCLYMLYGSSFKFRGETSLQKRN